MPVTKDGLGGLLFAAIGLFALVTARDYPAGSALSMGPGYVPTIVSALILGLGLLLFLRGLRRGEDDEPVSVAWLPLALVTAAIAGFAMLIPFGILVAVTYLVVVAWLADPHRRLKALPVLILAGIGVTVLIFKVGLGLPIPM